MSGEMRPHGVRRGEYLTKIAHWMAFDAEEVWKTSMVREVST